MANLTDELTIALNELLERDKRTADSQIEALSDNGVVTLTGIAFSHKARMAAAEVVERFPGVLSVINDIEVRDAHHRHDERVIVPVPVRPLGPNQ